jgi:hypothetical protein
VDAAREHVVIRLQPRLLDPLLNGISGGWGDLELNWSTGLVLHDHRPRRHCVTVADVAHLEADQITTSELAVDAQVEQGKLAYSALHLQTDTECPDIPELERRLLADDLALVPWLAVNCVGYRSHDGLPSG